MYAIVEIAGKQYKVKPGMKLEVPRLELDPGKKFKVEKVLAFAGEDGFDIGTPVVKNVTLEAEVLEHGRGKKIIVFKKKRRKGYQKKQGHRQDYTLINITKMEKAAAKRKATRRKAEPKPEPAAEETAPATVTEGA